MLKIDLGLFLRGYISIAVRAKQVHKCLVVECLPSMIKMIFFTLILCTWGMFSVTVIYIYILSSSFSIPQAFGNAKTAHNNNSSRFGKFIQVTYKENGLVQGLVKSIVIICVLIYFQVTYTFCNQYLCFYCKTPTVISCHNKDHKRKIMKWDFTHNDKWLWW